MDSLQNSNGGGSNTHLITATTYERIVKPAREAITSKVVVLNLNQPIRQTTRQRLPIHHGSFNDNNNNDMLTLEEEEEAYEDYTGESILPSSNLDQSVVSQTRTRTRIPYNKKNTWKPWQRYFLNILVRIPGYALIVSWFRCTSNLEWGIDTNRYSLWEGIQRADMQSKLKSILMKILIGFLLLCFIWFMLIPYATGRSGVGRRNFQEGVVETPKLRIDHAGIRMFNPLALCPLLYDRATKAIEFLNVIQSKVTSISNIMYTENQIWAKTKAGTETIVSLPNPPTESDIRKIYSKSRQEDSSELWKHFIQTEVTIPTKDKERDALISWLDIQCNTKHTRLGTKNGRPTKLSDVNQFSLSAQQDGYIAIDVTHRWQQQQQIKQISSQDSAEYKAKTQRLADAIKKLRPTTDSASQTRETATQQQMGLFLLSPDDYRVYRNVSLYDLDVFMCHFAAEDRVAWNTFSEKGIPNLKQQVPVVYTALKMIETSASFWVDINTKHQTDCKTNLSLMEMHAANLLWKQEAEEKVQFMRSKALWSGMNIGCVCAHHIGIPIPAAAWVNMITGTPQSLFYPTLPDSGGGVVSSFMNQLFGGGGADDETPEPKLPIAYPACDQPHKSPLITMKSIDPVLTQAASHTLKQHLGQKTWIEGFDSHGLKHRLRLQAPELACVSSCVFACGDSQK